MTQSGVNTPPVIKHVSILIGDGDQTYGLVSLAEDGTLTIAGNATRITRLLAHIRRRSPYRAMTNEQFLAVLPEAVCDGHTWVAPAGGAVGTNGRATVELGMQ